MNSIESALRKWQHDGLHLVSPLGEAAVHSALTSSGRKYSRDIVALYCATGGMSDGEMDSHCWSLWTLDRLISENRQYERPYLLFADFLIGSHLYCFKYKTAETSAVCVDYFNGQDPRLLSHSVSEFFDLFMRDGESLEMFH